MATHSLFWVFLLLVTPFSGCLDLIDGVTAEGAFSRTLDVNGPMELDVSSGAGSIHVRRGAPGEVTIHGKIRVRRSSLSQAEDIVDELAQEPPIEQTGSVIRVGRIDRAEWRRNVSISYEITVPVQTLVRARTGSGSVDVDGVEQTVEARSGSGSVRISRVTGSVDAEAGSGSVTVTSTRGAVKAHTGSGSIRAEDVAGHFNGSTGSGSISVEQSGPGGASLRTGSGRITASGVEGPLEAQTGSGSIRVQGSPVAAWRARTGSGSISLRLPPDAAFDFDGRSSSGGVSIDHPVTVTVQGRVNRKHVQGKVRGGGPLVKVETGSGSIGVE